MKRLSILVWLLYAGCASQSAIEYSRTKSVAVDSETTEEVYSVSQRFTELARQARGQPFGDLVFADKTSAHWILPELDALDLRLAAIDQALSEAVYSARLTEVIELHENFLMFSIDLRMPFYSGWAQSELIAYLEDNLVMTLENGSGEFFVPQLLDFQERERFQPLLPFRSQTDSRQLEVSMPVRAYFARVSGSQAIVGETTKQLLLRLGLRENPPFIVGFFDEKFFQGFKWKISR